MRIRNITAAAATIAAIGSIGAVATTAQAAPSAAATQAATRQVEGTVLSVNRSARTFRLRDSQRGTFTIKVTSRTTFERVGSFSGLRAGMTRIEANIRRSGGAWVASHVERSGGGGSHGGGSDD
jgi:phage baseplate assembly protein gpV